MVGVAVAAIRAIIRGEREGSKGYGMGESMWTVYALDVLGVVNPLAHHGYVEEKAHGGRWVIAMAFVKGHLGSLSERPRLVVTIADVVISLPLPLFEAGTAC